MKVHVSLNVKDLTSSVEFYKKMFNIEPAKEYPAGTSNTRLSGYAKFDIAEPPLNLALNEVGVAKGGSLSHLGVQVATSDDVNAVQKRWEEIGLIPREEKEVACCYAKQDKAWVTDPDGNEWEVFTVLENISPNEEQTGCCDPVNEEESTAVETVCC